MPDGTVIVSLPEVATENLARVAQALRRTKTSPKSGSLKLDIILGPRGGRVRSLSGFAAYACRR